MIEIYRKSIAYCVTNLAGLITCAALIEGLVWLIKPKHESAVTFVPLVLIAYYFHRHFLFGENLTMKSVTPRAETPPVKFGWFMLASAGIIGVPVAISLVIVFSLFASGAQKNEIVGAVILILGPAYLLTLSLFGTALPALVARDGSYRLSAGMRAVFQTMWRLIAGPGVVGLVGFLVVLMIPKLQFSLGIREGSLGELGLFVILRTLGFIPTIFAVAVLCSMYMKVTARPDAA